MDILSGKIIKGYSSLSSSGCTSSSRDDEVGCKDKKNFGLMRMRDSILSGLTLIPRKVCDAYLRASDIKGQADSAAADRISRAEKSACDIENGERTRINNIEKCRILSEKVHLFDERVKELCGEKQYIKEVSHGIALKILGGHITMTNERIDAIVNEFLEEAIIYERNYFC